jgi:predicted TIM-barrel fold metal-dependent hydrolase
MKKVMWGTDWPVQNLTRSLEEARALGIPEEALDGLLGENAIRILKLDVQA